MFGVFTFKLINAGIFDDDYESLLIHIDYHELLADRVNAINLMDIDVNSQNIGADQLVPVMVQ